MQDMIQEAQKVYQVEHRLIIGEKIAERRITAIPIAPQSWRVMKKR